MTSGEDSTIDESALRNEIAAGESSTREFKSTLRWSIGARKNEQSVTLSALTAIAAFLNSSGGVLFIGVRDDGLPHGIESDGFANDDKFIVALYEYVKGALGPSTASNVHATVYHLDGKAVCRVSVTRCPRPVFLTFATEREVFFIRTGPVTTKLPASRIHIYIGEHWKSEGPTVRPRMTLEYATPAGKVEGGFRFRNTGDAAAFNVSAEIPISDTLWAVKLGPVGHVERGVPAAELPDCWHDGVHVFKGRYRGDFRNFMKGAYLRRFEELTAAGVGRDAISDYLRSPHASKFSITYSSFDSAERYSTDHVLTYSPSDHLVTVHLDQQ